MSQPKQFYSELEKSRLVELVGKHKYVLKSKKNDYTSIRQKTSRGKLHHSNLILNQV